MNARQQLNAFKRLAEKLVRARADAAYPVLDSGKSRDKHDRYQPRFRIALEFPADLKSVPERHLHVHQNYIRPEASKFLLPANTVKGHLSRVTLFREKLPKQVADDRIVIDDQNLSIQCVPPIVHSAVP